MNDAFLFGVMSKESVVYLFVRGRHDSKTCSPVVYEECAWSNLAALMFMRVLIVFPNFYKGRM